MLPFILLILLTFTQAFALEMSKRDFCLTAADASTYKLSNKFKIKGNVPHPALISTVAKLVDEFEIQGPLIFHFTDYQGPRKVWSLSLSDGKHIYFAKNAIDLLLGIEIEKIADEVCQPHWTGRKTFTVTYTNTVMEQFLRQASTKASLEKVLTKRTGWKLRSSPGEKHYDEEQDFRTEELITLVKQLMDLPAEVFQKMKIKKVTRWRYGAPLPIKGSNAIYFIEEQKIMIGDGALMDSATDVYGEGTILHEMGHAYWFGVPSQIREKFADISWKKKEDKWERISGTSEGFISEYSMKSPEEDFAEHFSAYMHQPELLTRKASRKKRFIEDNVFTDVTFFSTVAENAKVKITSPTPDTKDPWLEKDLASSFTAKAIVRDDDSKITDISVVVNGAYDDLSGIDSTIHRFEHVDNREYRIQVKLIPEQQADGSFRLVGDFSTNPKQLAAGLYRSSTFDLNDMAGNTQYYDAKDIPDLYIEGNLAVEEVKPQEMDVSKIKLEQAPVVNGYHGIITTLPIPFQENLYSIHITWEFTALEGKTIHVCQLKHSRRSEVPCMISSEVGEPIRIQSYFHKEYPASTVKLASLYFEYKGTSKRAKSKEDHIIPQNQPNAAITLDSGTKELELIDLDVNQMKLKAVSSDNRHGGDQNIEVTVPLINGKAGGFRIMTKFRSPTGKQILGITAQPLEKEYERVEINGEEFLKFKVPLKKNPEDGVYILESFEVHTEYERPFKPDLPLDQNKLSVRKIKLLERGIRRTFTISDDKIINLD